MSTKAEFDIVTALRSMEFFHDMGPKHLHKLATAAREVTYQRGDFIYQEGDLDKGMYLLKDGDFLTGEIIRVDEYRHLV